MRGPWSKLSLAFALLAFPPGASGEFLRVEAETTISSLDLVLTLVYAVGDPVSVSFVIDTDAPAGTSGGSDTVHPAVVSFDFTVGTNRFRSVESPTPLRVGDDAIVDGQTLDFVYVQSQEVLGPFLGQLGPVVMEFAIAASDLSTLSSQSIPDVTALEALIERATVVQGLLVLSDGSFHIQRIHLATPTSLQVSVVPEAFGPATSTAHLLVLAGAGVGLAARRWRAA